MIRNKYRDHEIEFDEATEIWRCADLGLADKSLAKLKTAVDRESKKMRSMRVPALLVYQYHHADTNVKEVTITLVREGGRSAQIEWIDDDGDERKERADLFCLFPRDQSAAIAAYTALRSAALDAEAAADEAWSKLKDTVFTPGSLREFVAQQAEKNP